MKSKRLACNNTTVASATTVCQFLISKGALFQEEKNPASYRWLE
jgi:hypothetical protein